MSEPNCLEPDAYGREGERMDCDTCNSTGVEYGETCVTCGGFGWLRGEALAPMTTDTPSPLPAELIEGAGVNTVEIWHEAYVAVYGCEPTHPVNAYGAAHKVIQRAFDSALAPHLSPSPSDAEREVLSLREDVARLEMERLLAPADAERDRMRAALQDIADAEPIPNDAVAFTWCRNVAQEAIASGAHREPSHKKEDGQ